MLAIEAAPTTSSPSVSKSCRQVGWRSQSASASSSSLIKSSPLPPIASNSSWADVSSADANVSADVSSGNVSASTVINDRPSSSPVASSNRSSLHQPDDKPSSESFFMTEVLSFNFVLCSLIFTLKYLSFTGCLIVLLLLQFNLEVAVLFRASWLIDSLIDRSIDRVLPFAYYTVTLRNFILHNLYFWTPHFSISTPHFGWTPRLNYTMAE